MLNKCNTTTLVRLTSLVRITSGSIYRHFSRVMVSVAVFTAAIDLAEKKTNNNVYCILV